MLVGCYYQGQGQHVVILFLNYQSLLLLLFVVGNTCWMEQTSSPKMKWTTCETMGTVSLANQSQVHSVIQLSFGTPSARSYLLILGSLCIKLLVRLFLYIWQLRTAIHSYSFSVLNYSYKKSIRTDVRWQSEMCSKYILLCHLTYSNRGKEVSKNDTFLWHANCLVALKQNHASIEYLLVYGSV